GRAVLPCISARRHRFLRLVLDAQNSGERHRDPPVRDGTRKAVTVWWIGECNVEGASVELLDETDCVAAMHSQLGPCTEHLAVLVDSPDASGTHFHEIGGRRATRQRFQSERARSGKRS